MSQPSTSTRRTARKIRYHDHEWDEVVAQARAAGLDPAAFVRKVSLGNDDTLALALGRVALALHALTRRAPEPTHAEIQRVLDETLAAIRKAQGRS